jgi:diguanylate cyclase (GGDEF)-like protein
MKRLILAFVVIFGLAAAVSAAAPAPLATLRAIHALTNAEADHGLPVAFEATVTYYNSGLYTLFVQDDGAGIYVRPPQNAKLVPGDRILIRGKTHGSFRPIVSSDSISVLRHGNPPKPAPATFRELIRGENDCMLVTVRGIIHAIDRNPNSYFFDRNPNSDYDSDVMQVLTNGGYIVAIADHFTPAELEGLLDAEVEITGVAGGLFDGKYQRHGVQISVSSPANVKTLKHASASLWSLPITPMDQVVSGYQVTDRTQRVRVHGTVTYYLPGSSVVLQDGNKSLWIATQTQDPLRIGDVVDASGFPAPESGFLTLTRGEIRDTHTHAPIAPLPTTFQELAASRHVFDLVSVEGQVVSTSRGATQDEYDLSANGQLFSAIYRHPPGTGAPPPMKEIPAGSRVRVTGICFTEDSNPFAAQVAFDILMRSFDDISVVAIPSLLNVRNLIILVGLLVAIIIAVGARGWAIEHRVRRQIAGLALVEQRRSRILEDINGSRPLAGIVEEITELVSFKLRGAPCWCQIADGAQLGNCPPKLSGLRIINYTIPAHAGPALGDLFAAFDPDAKPNPSESAALSMAVALTALAIETRRLYSDLRHRSEFDLLTDIHNRFSLDKYLDRQIEEAREHAGIFGLIYIDLDKFKQVNDLCGHHIGDLYLQEVALRMKRQLRNVDMLARLGGDEFAVLLPQVCNRARVEEIAQRLERSFDKVFIIEGHTLHGSASVGIAVYPKDGATRDDLLSAADGAMYLAKHGKVKIATV